MVIQAEQEEAAASMLEEHFGTVAVEDGIAEVVESNFVVLEPGMMRKPGQVQSRHVVGKDRFRPV